jgi:hypothetical protein
MKKIILKEKNNVWTLTLIGNEGILKKATLSGLYAFAEKVDILDLETVRGTMGLAGMLANDKVLSQEERDTAQSYYQTLNQRYRELSDHT